MGGRRYYKGRSHGITKREQFQWLVVGIIFAIGFIIYFIYGFFINCIFEWPPRLDIGVCWDEQKAPAQRKAIEDALKFAP